MKTCAPLLLAMLATPAISEGTRELGSHEHGVGELNIAVDGTTVAMELHAPGADIVGFEYEAETAEDHAEIDAAIATLSEPLTLFGLPAGAGCGVTEVSAELESEADHDDHEEHEKHNDHDHDDHDDHGDEHAHDDDEHHDEEVAANHTEFHAEYTLTCSEPGALSQITFAYFDVFENALELEVQVVTDAGAAAFEVERDAPTLDLSDIF